MPFKDIEQIIEPLTLPIRGKEYVIPPMGVLSIARYEEMLENPEQTMTNAEFYAMTLGDAYEQMRADNVSPVHIHRAAYTSLADTQRGRAVAEVMWETGGDPKAADPAPAEKTPPAAASTTKRRATGSGTKTSRKS